MKRITIVGSRSGGHIIPGLVVGREEHDRGAAIYFIAEARSLDEKLLGPENWLADRLFLSLPTIQYRSLWRYPLYLSQIAYALYVARCALRRWKVSRVVGMGGISSFVVCSAARILGIPYVLYELNAVPGAAVRWLMKGAATVYCCFPEAMELLPAGKASLVPYPIRFQESPHPFDTKLLRNFTQGERARQASNYNFSDSIDTTFVTLEKTPLALSVFRNEVEKNVSNGCGVVKQLLVIGGSQGSQELNRLIRDWLRGLSAQERQKIYVLHQAGKQAQELQEEYQQLGVQGFVFAYYPEMENLYQRADFVVTRAGSGALHELIYFNCRGLIIPLEHVAENHQVANARSIVRRYPDAWSLFLIKDKVVILQRLSAWVQEA